MTNGVEETVSFHILLLSRLGVLDSKVSEEVSVSLRLSRDSVPENSDLGVVHCSLGHDLGSTENVSSNEHVDVRSVLQKKKVYESASSDFP